ncbi:tRNA lysidine(34) synthetase TilS [Bacillus tianshenii]|nr:tRNA lysidine(34) synthetase TilS [Bacillus tianshenii]
MNDLVKTFIEKHHLINDGETIIVGLSGGPDSLALLHYLYELKEKRNLYLVAVHLNHMFRGEEAEKDCIFVKHFCDSIDIPIVTEKIDVPAYQKKYHLNAQEAARKCRYQLYEKIMHRYDADKLALAHHGDDQVETVFMKMARGNVSSLKGMPVRRPFATGEIIRPFLPLSKDEIEEYCKKMKLQPRRDPSNEKPVYTRNRFRKTLLPFLKEENPKVHRNIQYISEVIEAEDAFLNELTQEKMQGVLIEKTTERCIFDINAFGMLSVPLQRRAIHLILKYLYPKDSGVYTSIHIEDILTLCRQEHPSGELMLPYHLRIIRTYDRCIMTFHIEKQVNFYHELSVPGRIKEEDAFEITAFDSTKDLTFDSADEVLQLPKDSVVFPLIVRNRKQGDKMEIFKDGSKKKVSRIFIDAKVSRLERDNWPIVSDYTGRIIWIPEIRKAYDFIHSSQQECICVSISLS